MAETEDTTPSYPTCAGCEAEIIAVTGGHWTLTVSTPFGSTLPTQTFCLACMGALAARGVRLSPPYRSGGGLEVRLERTAELAAAGIGMRGGLHDSPPTRAPDDKPPLTVLTIPVTPRKD